MRKKVYNLMEDMKGKIRVYARVRPMLQFEGARGQRPAINIPDELTVDHMWKDKKREYNFDSVFAPESSQEQVTLLLFRAISFCSYQVLVVLGIFSAASHMPTD